MKTINETIKDFEMYFKEELEPSIVEHERKRCIEGIKKMLEDHEKWKQKHNPKGRK